MAAKGPKGLKNTLPELLCAFLKRFAAFEQGVSQRLIHSGPGAAIGAVDMA